MRAILDCDRSGCDTLIPLQEFDSARDAPSWNLQVAARAAIGQTFSTELSRNECSGAKDPAMLRGD
jgi:hypothetical protein